MENILLTIFGAIIGAMIGAYFSYCLFVILTIKNLRKSMKYLIKSKLQLCYNNKYHNVGVYQSQLKYIKECLNLLNDFYLRFSIEAFKLRGFEHKYFIDIKQKLNYLGNELYLIDEFIELNLKKVDEKHKDGRRFQLENLFLFNDILNDMENVSVLGIKNNPIDKCYASFRETITNGVRPKEYNLI